MNELVFIESSKSPEPFTTSDVIAEFAQVQRHTITRLIQQHEQDFKDFGILRFQIEEINGRGQPAKHYLLNEQQATLLIAYLKNTSRVRAFKKELVRQFYAMRSELMKRQIQRAELKPIRRELTDVIQEVDESKWAYKKYTDLAYKSSIGKNAAQLRKERNAPKTAIAVDYMASDEIAAVTKRQSQISVLLEMGMNYEQVKAMVLERRIVGALNPIEYRISESDIKAFDMARRTS